MGGVPMRHHTSSKVGRRRSHLALKKKNVMVCAECKAPILPHRYCSNCGYYGKKKVTEVKAKTKKNVKK
ncbi:MAG: 50S ribosomal protein L32 [Candidatus Colwellbacteria bacterium RIFCSPLOWO2_12_FULL_44_13]|uniref:Large ribosomal subunit protein bL32 n=3 Tax=Candidatus Colwelliibacteriota TaxID=1817904 RepID=A0A1G1Z5E6_9BACT|nr:MAG: 50S ribosomal protein L32 [Candidatus Colwellbacteria bacterium RIFCSPHIGHO2_12_FULL_44_17]OGY59858.1 MAG: 50S ribosomal protein L32 [Candidatus Colwellbacteria bacterium RIFCSPLOWO2_02_FULL_44_20b]OGY61763.1 MAG: 50S ribosomal protein L32 [Candidatus Colwellbacteria bacterium RIFCSPLOWO2_12_FULL_44_13]